MDLDGVENPMCLYGMNFAVSDDSRPLVICKDEASALTGHILDPGTDYLATGSLLWNVEIPGWVKKRRIFIAPDSGDYESCMEQWSMLLKDIAWLCIDTVFPDYEDAICRQGLNPLGNYYLHRFRKLQTTEPYEALRTFATLSNGLLNVDVWDFMRNFQLYIKS